MKLRILSDLHMEGWEFKYEPMGEDVVLLAGDIHTQNRHEELLRQIPDNIPILFVPGNHEYYGKDFDDTNEVFEGFEDKYPNFHFLDNREVVFNDIHFFGGTMFTDFNLHNDQWFAKRRANECIADFGMIKTTGKHFEHHNWNPQDHIEQHEKFVERLDFWLERTDGKKRVVMTHFMPTPKLTHPRFEASGLNPYFTANMERFMGWEGLWVCGHGHDSADVMVGDTRLVMNPRGYGKENLQGFNPNLILEI